MSDINDMIRSSIDGLKAFTDVESVVGAPITTASGVTVIPVSKVTLGYAGAGLDFGGRKPSAMQNFGGGSGTGLSITPVAFLTVTPDNAVNLITLEERGGVEKVASLIEHSPEIIEKVKRLLT